MEIVETTEPVEVKLSDVCRSCLMKTDNMTNFFSKNKTANDVITMLSSVELNDLLPSYLCKNCEEKLRISYDFQLLIQRSNDIIRQCLNGANFVSEFEDNEIEVTKLDSNENISDSAEIEEKPKNKQSMRLPQFSADEVERAIEQSKRKFYANINCIKCGFVSCNTRALSVHMTHLHKEAKEHWCSICNLEVEDLPEHLLSHAHDDLKCKFCGKTFTAKGHFTEHLRSHSNIRPYKCHLCGKGFISTRHLNTHLLTHTNNRPHKCPICPRSFIIQSSLRNHVKNHWQSLSKSESESQERQEDPLRITAEDGLSQIKQLSVPQNFCKICKKKVRSLTAHLSKFHQNSSNREHQMVRSFDVICALIREKFHTSVLTVIKERRLGTSWWYMKGPTQVKDRIYATFVER
ncbi:zf-AD domain containing protein [Asbolus verrucosus]|uniref:Zf-AD domain containing protein n=1 Tax=Asbolus verrucosus TaxID=1661398 RepID=A0A482VMZ6_ASBVE|nr:zf-AD domain containing protein [Asbolus verrucosus]